MSENLADDFRDDVPWNPILSTALDLLAEGVSVIPLKARSKEPALDRWKEYQDRLPSEDEVRSWFADPVLNIGVVCGPVSGNLFVLDFDTKTAARDFAKTYAALISGAPVVRTARGFHVYLRGETIVASTKQEDMDVKGSGGYVVGPGSTHPSGKMYELVRGDLAKIPVIEALAFSDNGGGAAHPEGWQDPLLQDVPEGERHIRMVELCGRWYGKGLSEAEVMGLAQGINSKWTAPLPEKEIEEIVRSLKVTHDRKHAGEQEEREPSRKRKLEVITIKDIRNFPDPAFLIENVLIENTIILLGSYAGKGKTIVALSLMRSVLDGFPWLGKFKVNHTGPVLFVNEENPDSVFKNYTMKVNEDSPFLALHFKNVRVDTMSGCEELTEVIEKWNPVLVVVDSLIRVHSHQEDSSIEMAQVIKHLRGITNTGITVLLLHHHNKGTGPLEIRARGSSDIPAGVDLELSLYEKKERLILQSVKSRFRPFEPIILEIFDDDGVPDIKLATSVKDEARDAIREILNEEPVDFESIRSHMEESGIDIGRDKLRKLLHEMENKELIITKGEHQKLMFSSFLAY